MIHLANPWGLLALLSLPAIVVIHLLQRQVRRVETSTLFLLEPAIAASLSGRRVDRLRRSMPLLLQLLAATLFSFALAHPRTIRSDSVQRVVFVLDSSVSMQAFRKETLEAVARVSAALADSAAATEWTLIESDRTKPRLYEGPKRTDLLQSTERWNPWGRGLDVQEALLAASGDTKTIVVFFTDRPQSMPANIRQVSVGREISNVGFAGLSMQESNTKWRVLVRNYSGTPQRRNWSIQADATNTPQGSLEIAAGGTITLEGPLDQERMEVVLESDTFAPDDRLPLVRPVQKPLRVLLSTDARFAKPLVESVPGAVLVGKIEEADLAIVKYDPFLPGLPATASLVHVSDPAPAKKYEPGDVVAQRHSLVDGLEWRGLLVPASSSLLGLPTKKGDEPLVWVGSRPAVFLRESARSLIFNFDPDASNVTRLPAFVLICHRFIQEVRDRLRGEVHANFELQQLVALGGTDGGSLQMSVNGAVETIPSTRLSLLRAPEQPGFFTISDHTGQLLVGAAHFADSLEADFREAGTKDETVGLPAELRERNSEADFAMPLWLLLAGVLLLLYWSHPWRAESTRD